jgi:hypothetical protein
MASIQLKNGAYYCQFRHDGRRHTDTVGKVTRAKAEAFADNVEELLDHVRRGRVTIPAGVSVSDFVKCDGKAFPKATTAPDSPVLSVRGVLDGYLSAIGGGALEASTVRTLELHARHLKRLLGQTTEVSGVTRDRLQKYVNARVAEKHHGRPIHRETPRKELNTRHSAWKVGG